MKIDPPSLNSGNAFWTVNSVPRVFRPKVASKCCSVISPSGTASPVPALAYRMSILPFSRLTVSNRRSRSSRLAASPRTPVTFRPISLTASSSAFCLLPVMNTEAPSSTNRFALASAKPLDPPVMTATLPSSFPMIPSLQSNCGCPLSTRQDRIEMCDHDSSVELDQVLKDQLTPAISARLHKQSTFQKPAKCDRRETEMFRKRANLRCGAVIVARQEHDSPAPMYGRILVKDGSNQMVEALDQSCASEGLRDELGRRLSSQFLRGHAVGIGHIDDRLPLPGAQRLRDILVRLETDSQKDDVRLDRFRQLFGND